VLTQYTNANGETTTSTYDSGGNLSTETDPDGFVTSYLYDGYGNVTEECGPSGGCVRNDYDSQGRLFKMVDRNGKAAARLRARERTLQQPEIPHAPAPSEPRQQLRVQMQGLLERWRDREPAHRARRSSSSACCSMTAFVASRNAGRTLARSRYSRAASVSTVDSVCPVALA